jgi:Flp pilus assembly protein TadD
MNNTPFYKSRNFIIAAIVTIVVAVPIIIIVASNSGSSSTEAPAQNPAQEEALAQLENLRAAAEANPTLDNLLNLGVAYINNGNPNAAIKPLEDALKLEPTNARVLNNLGLACTMVNAIDKGIKYGTLAVEQSPEEQLFINNLNWAKSRKDEIVKENDSLMALPSDQKTVDIYTKVGLNYSYIGQKSKSNEAYMAIIKLEPNSAIAYNNLGCNYIDMKDFEKAKTALNKAIELAPEEQLYKNNLNWALDEEAKASAGRGVASK